MSRLRNTIVRLGAMAILAVLVVAPPVLLTTLIGRPWPKWATLSDELASGSVSTETTMRTAAALFVLIWVWAMLTIGREAIEILLARQVVATRQQPAITPAISGGGPSGPLVRLVRIALLGTVTTATTLTSFASVAVATPSQALYVDIPHTPTTRAEGMTETATFDAHDTITADGRQTPLSIAIDLGDESLRTDIIALNPEWTGGPFDAGARVTIPRLAVEPASAELGTVELGTVELGTTGPIHGAPTAAHTVRPNDGWINVVEALWGADDTVHWLERRSELNGQEVAPGLIVTAATDTIHPGWTFTLPADGAALLDPDADHSTDDPTGVASDSGDSHVVHMVVDGDSLSQIAWEHLGDADAWPAIFDANAGAEMADGRIFTDPNLIVPGWTLNVPVQKADPAPPVADEAAPDVDSEVPGADAANGIPTADHPDRGVPKLPAPVHPSTAPSASTASSPTTPPIAPPTVPPAIPSTVPPAIPSAVPPAVTPTVPPTTPLLAPTTDPSAGQPAVPQTAPTHASTSFPSVPPTAPAAAPTSPPTVAPTTSTTLPADAGGGTDATDQSRHDTPDAPSPVRVEHAALLAAGILALVGVRRRQRLRAATPRARVPEPPPSVVATERRLRTLDAGERSTRIDVAIRAAARSLIDTDARIGLAVVGPDGDLELRLTASATLPPPWQAIDDTCQSWRVTASVPIELLSDDARRVGTPCVALVQLGVADGRDVLVDLEACGTLAVDADLEQADQVVTAIAAGLASSPYAEVAHLISVSLPAPSLLRHRNAHHAATPASALELAASLVGSTMTNERSSFALRSLRTGGEMWEPAVILLSGADREPLAEIEAVMPRAGHGIGVVASASPSILPNAPARLVGTNAGWMLNAFGATISVDPVGLTPSDLDGITAMLDNATAPLIDASNPVANHLLDSDFRGDVGEHGDVGHHHGDVSDNHSDEADHSDDVDISDRDDQRAVALLDDDHELVASAIPTAPSSTASVADTSHTETDRAVEPFVWTDHHIVVRLMGGVDVVSRDGDPGVFERSKTVELIAWLATHRGRSTRTAARTALWELDVRDATFANVVSEARRALARLVTPDGDYEWLARTLTEQLPLHSGVVTDAQLIDERLVAARLQPPAHAIETLRPAAELIRDMPFAGTGYLWPDAEGITSNLVLLATGVSTELAGHALSIGDTDLVFWATGQGLKVLPGHEELIALRMRAHARAGDLAGVRQEWESYERVIVADAWSDGEPAPKLLALRRELLTSGVG